MYNSDRDKRDKMFGYIYVKLVGRSAVIVLSSCKKQP